MRKIALLLSALLVCLLCGWTGNAAAAHPAAPSGPCLTLDRSVSDAWACEREFNSDLGLPRLAAEASPASVTPPSLREERCFLRLGVKCGVVCGREGASVTATSKFEPLFLFSGSCAVDYYVYRLRRLII